MATAVKIGMVGAGSATFAATVVRDLCVTPGLYGSHVALMDVDERRLSNVLALARRLAAELRADLTFSATTDRAQALAGADFVIDSAQAGGHAWVEAQRSLAERHGYYRGARLELFTQMELLLDVAHSVERICPHAWLVQISNPVFEGCTLMTRATSVKVLGLCHGHYGYRAVARRLGLELADVRAQMPGFNHWIWLTEFRYRGQDAYPLLDDWIATQAEAFWAQDAGHFHEVDLSRAAVHQYHHYGLLPIGDTPRFAGWWYHTDLATKQRWYGRRWGGFDSELGWSEYLREVSAEAERVEQAAADTARPVTETFPPRQSDEQIVPIIDSLVNDRQALYQVNIPNTGPLIQGFPEDLVVEVQGVVDATGIHGAAVPPLPRKLLVEAMIPRWHAAELAVEAMRSGDRDLLLAFLLNDRRTRSLEQAEGLLAEWLSDPRNASLAAHFGAT